MAHWSVVAVVSVPAMTRSSMDAIRFSSWKMLSFLFFSLRDTSIVTGKKALKIGSVSTQRVWATPHNPHNCWARSCVCELGDGWLDLAHTANSTKDRRFGVEWWFGIRPHPEAAWGSGPDAVDSLSLTGLERARSLPCTEGDSTNPRPFLPRKRAARLHPHQCSKWHFRVLLLGFRTAVNLPPYRCVEELMPHVGPAPVGKKKKLRAQIFCVEWNQLMCEIAESLLKWGAGQG